MKPFYNPITQNILNYTLKSLLAPALLRKQYNFVICTQSTYAHSDDYLMPASSF